MFSPQRPQRTQIAVTLAAVIGIAAPAAAQSRVTFTKDVAPIVFAHCASCHRPGEIAPFSVLTYRDVRPRASAIARAVRLRAMPPWKPEPDGAGEFLGERRLTGAEIRTIERWVELGALEGDPADLPPPPAFTEGWRLGQPDLVVSMSSAYALPGGGSDVLRNFVMPIPGGAGTRYVSGIEFRPGNARVVHHANIRIDRSRAARLLDQADPEPGYDGRINTGSFPDGHFLGWTPGQLPPLVPEMAWPLEANSDLVVQLHMKPGDSPELVQASVGFFFADRPAAPTPLMLRLGRQNIDIPPGDARYMIEDRYVLPVDVVVVGVQPHAHYRAREVSGFALLPDGTRRRLIEINDWDFNWQDAYRYAEPFSLPRGTVLAMRYTYDNSPANRRNPDRPPRRVRWGQNSTDEMGDLWIQVLPRTNQDRELLRADFGPKVLAEDAAGYEKTLEADPDNFRLHEAVAAIYLLLDKSDRAIPHLKESLRVNPGSVEAHYNLATALVWQRRPDESIEHFRLALQINPNHVAAHVNLGAVYRSRNRLDEAVSELRRALQLDPGNAAAHTNLAGAFAAQGHAREAIAHYRLALEASGDLLEALTDLSWILATHPNRELRDPGEAVRLAEHAALLTKRQDARVLETLGAGLAAAGQFDHAVATMLTAVEIADRAGATGTARQLRERLELYRKGIALREP